MNKIKNLSEIDSPSLILIKEIMESNIEAALEMVSLDRFRPHVKTNKILEVCKILKNKGVTKFKASTISELEMLGMIDAKDVLLAHQLTPLKMERFINLSLKYPNTKFSCVFDNYENLVCFDDFLDSYDFKQDIFIDVNVGMNRTGLPCNELIVFFQKILKLKNINIKGFHIYDGHIRETNIDKRNEIVKEVFNQAYLQIEMIENLHNCKFQIVAGGSPSFSVHSQNSRVECSPGTFVFWDWKYSRLFPDLKFECAVYIISRVISILDSKTICLDVGHKAVAAENPFPRLKFLNFPEAKSIMQSEEHLVIEITDTSNIKIGDVLIGIPDHICPTIALHENIHVIENNVYVYDWNIIARKRKINI
ncbi:D-serine deaminase, pyridoxal phosphate-dependent [Flavobacterium pectinovorum]|uniref:D-serine deaminase, pyridoxal phosphate-dependent n=2 Tax=Flavobacterium pectinovorum TaxID=29533 RepID=A0AB36NUR3_9FLAO|nr:alanine racemase [Flavobacterium pectinovorum]OXA98976.1 hypothetical protein B0A72_22970 [Flavobacterium pectinovorum]SHN22394.1 D-serine deaminase, pyridoxal phosphate-dependent [Flavobacterium pectinovorum]